MSNQPEPEMMSTIDLPEQLNHAACLALRPEIETLRGQALTLNAEHVAFLGGAGAELLLAIKSEWIADDLPFQISRASDAFWQGADHLGLTADLKTQEG